MAIPNSFVAAVHDIDMILECVVTDVLVFLLNKTIFSRTDMLRNDSCFQEHSVSNVFLVLFLARTVLSSGLRVRRKIKIGK